MTYDVDEVRLIAQQNDAFRRTMGCDPAVPGRGGKIVPVQDFAAIFKCGSCGDHYEAPTGPGDCPVCTQQGNEAEA